MACRSCRVGRGGRSGFSCRTVCRPCALPQSRRAPTARGESLCGIDGVAGARVGRSALLEDRQCPACTLCRVARDLAEFVWAQLNLFRLGWHRPILPQVAHRRGDLISCALLRSRPLRDEVAGMLRKGVPEPARYLLRWWERLPGVPWVRMPTARPRPGSLSRRRRRAPMRRGRASDPGSAVRPPRVRRCPAPGSPGPWHFR